MKLRGVLIVVLVALGLLAATGTANAATASPPTKGALYTDGQSGRYLLGCGWLYRPDIFDAGVADGFWRDAASTAGWIPVTVPNSYNARVFTNASMNGSVGWYRRDFTLPSGAFKRYVPKSAQRWMIRFESINYAATVWINGHRLGAHAGAYLPFELSLRHLHGGVNRLVVRVDDRRTAADFPPGPGGGWWNFGGIQREVYLRAVGRADVANVQVRPQLPCPSCAATIAEQATVTNPTGATQTLTLTGDYGGHRLAFGTVKLRPGRTWTPTATARLTHPQLWAPGSPHLYRATFTLQDTKHRRLQEYTVLSGVRSIKRTPGGRLECNGRVLSLRGVNIHEQSILTGSALSAAQLSRIMGWIRGLGAGVIRAHYPLNPQLEEAADRDGILLWSEVPVYQSGTTAMSESTWQPRALALLKDNILINQNHPSVMLWSVGNELPTPVTGPEGQYINAAAAEVHQLDPTRPAGMAVSSWPGVTCQSAYAPLDAVGFNDYFGWFDAGGGTTDDRDALGRFLDSFRACYPAKALFITELGFEGSRNGPVEERGTYQFQDDSLQFHLGVFAQKTWLSGVMYFAMQDFAARPGYSGGDPSAHPPFVEKGEVDVFGNRKPSFAVMSGIYHATRQIAPAGG